MRQDSLGERASCASHDTAESGRPCCCEDSPTTDSTSHSLPLISLTAAAELLEGTGRAEAAAGTLMPAMRLSACSSGSGSPMPDEDLVDEADMWEDGLLGWVGLDDGPPPHADDADAWGTGDYFRFPPQPIDGGGGGGCGGPEGDDGNEKALLWRTPATSSFMTSLHSCGEDALNGHSDSGRASGGRAPNIEIRMVLPVCVPVASDSMPSRLSVLVERTPPAGEDGGGPVAGCEASPHGSSDGGGGGGNSAVLIMTTSMELLSRAPIERDGAAHCTVPAARCLSINGTALLASSPSSRAINMSAAAPSPAMRVLTVFAVGGRSCSGAGVVGSNAAMAAAASPAAAVLCAPPAVAAELNSLFAHVAANLLALETDRALPHVQMLDVHGFTLLPGWGSLSGRATGLLRPPATSFTSPSGTTPDAHARILAGLATLAATGQQHAPGQSPAGPAAASATAPPVHLSASELAVCTRAWAQHFQPLLREVSYLLTCVPGAFCNTGSGLEWDHHTYCKTLAAMLAFLEHHRCFHMLSALLQHASVLGIALRHKGRCVGRRVLASPSELEQLLRSSAHDDISIQYQQQAPETVRRLEEDAVVEGSKALRAEGFAGAAAAGSEGWECAQGGSGGGCGGGGGYSLLPEVGFEDALASEFKDWEERWLVRGFSGTLVTPLAGPAAQPSLEAGTAMAELAVNKPLLLQWADRLPWEAVVLLLSCAVVAVQYAIMHG